MKKILFICVFNLLFICNVSANSLFNRNINVDVTAPSVDMAKKQALSKANRDAIYETMLQISTVKNADAINALTDEQLLYFIKEVSVQLERSSDIRYIAELVVTVNEDVLRAYMKENLMPFIVGEDKNVLVIPLLEDKDGQLDIWGDENFWKQAFVNQGNLKKGNLNIVTISKNLGNIANAKANNVFDMSQNQYYELSGFNNLEDIYVVKYSIKDNKIYIKHFPTNTIDEVVFTEETPEELVKLSVTHFKDNKKEIVVEQNESQVANKLEFVYKYPNLGQWTILKNYLQNKPLINDVKVVSMGSGKVHFAFEYVGIIENLEIDLRQKGYNIKKEGGYYVIN